MNIRIQNMANQALREDLFPVSVAVPANPAYDRDDPKDIACYIRDYLLAQPTLVREDDMLAGAFRFAAAIPCDHSEKDAVDEIPMDIPTDAYHKIGHKYTTEFFRPNSDYHPECSPICFLDWDHYCTNYPFVLKQGIKGYLKRIERAKVIHKHDPAKLRYLDAMAYTVETIRLYTQKVADDYRRGGREDLAQRMERVPWNAPENFRDAIQAYWFTWLFLPDCLGRMDQILNPYYEKDIAAGVLTEEEAYEVLCEFMIKVFSGRPGGGFTDHRSADNTFSIAGYTQEGKDGFNEVSRLIVEALADLPTWRPQANVRITDQTSLETMIYLAKINKRQSNVVFTSDEVRIPAFEKLGMTYEDAVEYTMVGCNEWTSMGKGHTGSQGFFNPLKALERVFALPAEELDAIATFEEFYGKYTEELHADVYKMMDLADAYFDQASRDMNVISSIFIDDCIEKALPLTRGGARYSASNWSCNGFANIIDSIALVRQFVYEQKRFALSEVAQILHDNWKGHDRQRQEILRDGEFWGNDNRTDEIAARFIATLESICAERTPKKGGVFRFGSYTGYNKSNVTMGEQTGASLDGRYAGDFLSNGMGTGVGKSLSGLTAYLKSVAKNDYSFLIGPLATNVMIDNALADTDEKMEKLAQLYLTFFELGGLQLQPTYLNGDEMERAQLSPKDYENLRVRVTGFSAAFIKLDKGVQDELITRARAESV